MERVRLGRVSVCLCVCVCFLGGLARASKVETPNGFVYLFFKRRIQIPVLSMHMCMHLTITPTGLLFLRHMCASHVTQTCSRYRFWPIRARTHIRILG